MRWKVKDVSGRGRGNWKVLLWSRSEMTSEPVTALSRGRSQKSMEEKPGGTSVIPPQRPP